METSKLQRAKPMSSTVNVQRPMNLRLPSTIASATERVQIFSAESEKPFVHETGKETITFSNGGSIAETYGEPGLLLTRPDGSKVEMDGAIRQKGENLEILLWGHKDRYGIGSDSWLQRISPDGAVSFENTRYEAASFRTTETGHSMTSPTQSNVYTTNVNADGSVTSNATSSQGRNFAPNISLEDGNVVYKRMGKHDLVVTPPVPMEWLIGQ